MNTPEPVGTSQTLCTPESNSYFDDRIHSSEPQSSFVDAIHIKKEESEEHERDLSAVSTNSTIPNDAANSKDPMLGIDGDMEFPEGGLKAYLVVFGSFMGLISGFGLLNTYGVIQTYVTEHQLKDIPESTVSWVFSIFLFMTFLTSIVSGTCFDRNGVRAPLIFGGLCTFGGMMGLANCEKVWQFVLSFSLLVGVGNGFTGPPCIGVVAHYFNRRRGLMCSLASAGGSIGGIIFPIMMRKLYAEVGYTWAVRVFAFVLGACYIVAIALMKERLPHKITKGNRWQKILSYTTAFDLKGLKSLDFLFLCLGCSFAECGVLIVATYHASFARAHGFSLSTAYMLISTAHLGGLPARWISGYMSDRVGRFNIIIITTICAGIVALCTLVPFGSKLASLYVFSALWGFMTGSVFPLLPVCCAQISKTEDFGRRYGTMYFIAAFGTLVCIPIAGAIIGDGSFTGYRGMVIQASVTIMASGLFYTVSRTIRVGPHFAIKF
jgi:MFS family permease